MVHGSFTGIRIGLATIKGFCDITKKPCTAVSSLEALAYTSEYEEDSLICSMIDAKHSNIYTGIFEYKNGTPQKFKDFEFCNINSFLPYLCSLKKKIFFVGNCGILYKDMIQSSMQFNPIIFEDTIPSSKYVGIAAFNKYNNGIFSNSYELSALYLKNSSAEEKNNENSN